MSPAELTCCERPVQNEKCCESAAAQGSHAEGVLCWDVSKPHGCGVGCVGGQEDQAAANVSKEGAAARRGQGRGACG